MPTADQVRQIDVQAVEAGVGGKGEREREGLKSGDQRLASILTQPLHDQAVEAGVWGDGERERGWFNVRGNTDQDTFTIRR